jgi:hypothetical protein
MTDVRRAWELAGHPPWSVDERASIREAITEAVAAEREACAQTTEATFDERMDWRQYATAKVIAAAIRARGKVSIP